MTRFASVIGTGSYLPSKVVSNDELSTFVDTSDAWIIARTGIRQRHIISDESCVDMAYEAAIRALQAAKVAPQEVDAIVVATTTADKAFPSVACTVQKRLGAYGCCAFDVQAVCAGFGYATGVANALIVSGQFNTVLIIGSDAMSRLMNWQDRSTCVLFGDGAGAMVVQASQQQGIIETIMRADGRHEELLHAPYLDRQNSDELDTQKLAHLTMQGKPVFKIAVHEMSKAALQLLEQNHFSTDDLHWLIPHQANRRIMDSIAKALRLPETKVISTVQWHANTSAASIPLAFDYGVREGKIQKGQLCLFVAFGGGFSWAATLLRF